VNASSASLPSQLRVARCRELEFDRMAQLAREQPAHLARGNPRRRAVVGQEADMRAGQDEDHVGVD